MQSVCDNVISNWDKLVKISSLLLSTYTKLCIKQKFTFIIYNLRLSQTVLAVSLCVEMTITCKLCESDLVNPTE